MAFFGILILVSFNGLKNSRIAFCKITRQDNFILIRLHRVQYGENINKIDSQSVFCSGS